MSDFSHYSIEGSSEMVDISEKKITLRVAKAEGLVRMSSKTIEAIEKKLLPKGDPFEIAKIAGIIGAKKNAELIPLCHNLNLNYIDVKISIDEKRQGVRIYSEVRLEGKTGAEMEALTAVTVAALTIYDMCKAVDKQMNIEGVRVYEKKGGRSDFSEDPAC